MKNCVPFIVQLIPMLEKCFPVELLLARGESAVSILFVAAVAALMTVRNCFAGGKGENCDTQLDRKQEKCLGAQKLTEQ